MQEHKHKIVIQKWWSGGLTWWCGRLPVNREEHQVVVTEASQKGIWTHGHLYGNRSRYVFSTYYRLGFRLLGLSCVLVQTHHLHRPKAHLRSLCCFKAFAKAEKSECYFNSPKVEAGQWVTGHRHHFPRKSKRRWSHAWKWLISRMVTLQTSSPTV